MLNKKVLICDDEPYVLEAVKCLIEQEGYDVITAEDGIKSLDAAQKERPDLIVLDITMEGMSGIEICRTLKGDPDTKNMYIMMLTAKGMDSDFQEGMAAGADEFVTKPFSPRKLRKRLHEILD